MSETPTQLLHKMCGAVDSIPQWAVTLIVLGAIISVLLLGLCCIVFSASIMYTPYAIVRRYSLEQCIFRAIYGCQCLCDDATRAYVESRGWGASTTGTAASARMVLPVGEEESANGEVEDAQPTRRKAKHRRQNSVTDASEVIEEGAEDDAEL